MAIEWCAKKKKKNLACLWTYKKKRSLELSAGLHIHKQSAIMHN